LDAKFFEDEATFTLRSPMPMPASGNARNARLFGIAHHALADLKETIPTRFQTAIMTPQVLSTFQQMQSVITTPLVGCLQRVLRASTTQLGSVAKQGRTADGAPGLIALSQAATHISRYYFSLFGSGQLLPYLKDLCSSLIQSFLVAAVLTKPMDEAAKNAIAQDMQSVEMTLSALDSDFQSHIRHETGIFNEFRKMIFVPSLGATELEELSNTIPLPLLLVFLVHQLPPEVPSLPAFCKARSAEAFAEEILLPLWQEEPEALATLKAKIAEMNAKFGIDRCIDPVSNFLKTKVK
jgi:hypothetical protein